MLWGANQSLHFRNEDLDFPDGPVVKNLPANARDTGSIPGSGRFFMLWNKEVHELQLLSPHAATTEAFAC